MSTRPTSASSRAAGATRPGAWSAGSALRVACLCRSWLAGPKNSSRVRGRGNRAASSGVDEPVGERVARQLGAAGEAELLLDVGAVGLDGADAEGELLADLAIGVAESHQLEN